jgi:chromosome segregation ATPase
MAGVAGRIGSLFNWTRRGHGPVQVDLVRSESEGDGREATLAQLRSGYTEIIDTMKAVRGHLEDQSQQSRRMLEVMQAMPDLLRAIPESNRNQTRVLEAIHANLEHQNRASSELAAALGGLTQATAKIGNHIQQGEESQQDLTDRLGTLNTTIQHLDQSNRDARETLRAAVVESDDRNKAVRDMVARSHRQVVVLSIVSWALAIIALGASVMLAIFVMKLANQAG